MMFIRLCMRRAELNKAEPEQTRSAFVMMVLV